MPPLPEAGPLRLERLGLVLHPKRDLTPQLEALRAWTDAHGTAVMELGPASRGVAPVGSAEDCDLVVALGGDGTVLGAVRAAAPFGKPVLGVGAGSLGALAAARGSDVASSLDAIHAGDWTAQPLSALEVTVDGHRAHFALNDLVAVRAGAGQVTAAIRVDGILYGRVAGDGLVVSTPLGSSAYAMSAGGPILAPGARSLLVTPLPAHGGCVPPLVIDADSALELEVQPGHHGARLELDGQPTTLPGGEAITLHVRLRPDHAALVLLGDTEPFLSGLRRRGIVTDSPRLLARDAREAAARGGLPL